VILLLETIVRRWYAVAFIAGFFWAASSERGWKRALRFYAIASVVALIFEYTSTHSGFPYGNYSYTGLTRGDELYISNVPAFVPVAHAVLMWAGRSIAIVGFRARSRAAIPWLAALGTVLVDMVVDPVSLHGGDWFLGDMYRWETAKGYLGVPLTNFLGWYFVAWLVFFVDEALDVGRAERSFDAIRGITLAFSVMIFNVLIALGIRQWRVALSGVVITAAVALMCLPTLREMWSTRDATGPPEPTSGEPRTDP
jgi:putative membrane protein